MVVKPKPSIQKAQNRLLAFGHPHHFNACLNFSSDMSGIYIDAFFSAGEMLLRSVLENRNDIDVLVYPIVFNYRHAFELALKRLLLLAHAIHGTGPRECKTHRLLDIWGHVRPHLSDVNVFDPRPDEFEQLADTLADFTEVDQVADAFRYACSKDGRRNLTDVRHINLGVFRNGVEPARRTIRRLIYQGEAAFEAMGRG